MNIQSTITLNNGVKMPWLGLGVYKVKEGGEVKSAVVTALQAGYRSIDTASFYENEVGVGEGIRESGIPREEIFVTTKVWNDQQGYEETLKAFEESRGKLGLDIIDLYLIHWPVTGKFKETWRALEELYAQGKVRAIGVSNFQIHHLEELLKDAKVVPAVNQVEYHPLLTQEELHTYCKAKGIQLEAWAPLVRGRVFDNPILVELSEKYGKTPAQIILRWDLQNDVVTIPKSITPARIEANMDIYDFELSEADMARISSLNENHRTGPDPDTFV
ncbi:MAG: aldo/keto reductase [Bacillus sp. (in: Bacteria)]|nr:aldo/keto reductase [Bacillus sp. (in: firmicutes)]